MLTYTVDDLLPKYASQRPQAEFPYERNIHYGDRHLQTWLDCRIAEVQIDFGGEC